MNIIKYPDERAVKKAIAEKKPLLVLIAFGGETIKVCRINEAIKPHALKNIGCLSTNINRYFRIVVDDEVADWMFVCPNDYKGIADKGRRIAEFYKDGFREISKALQVLGLYVGINISKHYRRSFDIAKDKGCVSEWPAKEMLNEVLTRAFQQLYSNDYYLICNESSGENNVGHGSERGIVCHFAHYLQNVLKEENCLSDLSVDCEYNRNGSKQKKLLDGKGVYPDLIIHRRGTNDSNFLVIEFKTWWHKGEDDFDYDFKKIKGFMDDSGVYKYQYGLSVVIEKILDDTLKQLNKRLWSQQEIKTFECEYLQTSNSVKE